VTATAKLSLPQIQDREAQLSIVGKGSENREALPPNVIAARLFASAAMRRRPRLCSNPATTWQSVHRSRRYHLGSCRPEDHQCLCAYPPGIEQRPMVLFDIKACGPSARVLDIGRGRGFDDEPALREELSSCSRHYIGVEPDTSMASATACHKFHVSARGREILRESIDVAFTVFVIERHIGDQPALHSQARVHGEEGV
jgi:hypothetical protein